MWIKEMFFPMIIDRPQANQAAKNCMRTARISPYQIGLVYILILLALSFFDSFMTQMFGTVYYLDAYNTVLMPSGINWFISILVGLISLILQAGFTKKNAFQKILPPSPFKEHGIRDFASGDQGRSALLAPKERNPDFYFARSSSGFSGGSSNSLSNASSRIRSKKASSLFSLSLRGASV